MDSLSKGRCPLLKPVISLPSLFNLALTADFGLVGSASLFHILLGESWRVQSGLVAFAAEGGHSRCSGVPTCVFDSFLKFLDLLANLLATNKCIEVSDRVPGVWQVPA